VVTRQDTDEVSFWDSWPALFWQILQPLSDDKARSKGRALERNPVFSFGMVFEVIEMYEDPTRTRGVATYLMLTFSKMQ
jgi:hypothetical protein